MKLLEEGRLNDTFICSSTSYVLFDKSSSSDPRWVLEVLRGCYTTEHNTPGSVAVFYLINDGKTKLVRQDAYEADDAIVLKEVEKIIAEKDPETYFRIIMRRNAKVT